MIEMLGFAYAIGKELFKYAKWTIEDKLVDRDWLAASGFEERMKAEGYTLVWSREAKVETRLMQGFDSIYEIDQAKRIKRRIIRGPKHDTLVLIGKKS